jgi:hypothetical protein
MKSMWRTAVLASFALAVLGTPAHADCLDYLTDLLSNGDFENGSSNWTTVQGYFAVTESPAASGNHVALLRGASNYTSTIQQSFSPTSATQHVIYLDMSGYGTCTVTATIHVGSQTTSYGDEVQYGALTFTFNVPSGVSTGTVDIAVTCPGSFLGRYISVDNVCIGDI